MNGNRHHIHGADIAMGAFVGSHALRRTLIDIRDEAAGPWFGTVHDRSGHIVWQCDHGHRVSRDASSCSGRAQRIYARTGMVPAPHSPIPAGLGDVLWVIFFLTPVAALLGAVAGIVLYGLLFGLWAGGGGWGALAVIGGLAGAGVGIAELTNMRKSAVLQTPVRRTWSGLIYGTFGQPLWRCAHNHDTQEAANWCGESAAARFNQTGRLPS